MSPPIPPTHQPSVIAPAISPILVPVETVPAQQGVVSFMSSMVREGGWSLARQFRVLCVMANTEIDLTQVRIAPGESEIEIRALMGEVNIIVPHHLRVECEGHPIMGSFHLKRSVQSTPLPEAPVVRITGHAIMASVTVKVIDPNGDKWRKRLRRRGALPPGV